MDRAEPRLVLGTAGHIDHGKTALVRALTGVDTDRLPEEKTRGITIDLGFAPLDLGPLRLGVVDVPGHEGLVRTMVAGATGIDLLLLVVAADEGVMPQTREHVAICELLGIDRGVVALTKADAVDEEMVELAAAEVEQLLAETALAGSPIVPVSALCGDGLDALREALLEGARAAAPRTPRRGPPRLPIDRAFEVRGFGPVATGTLVGGGLAVGDTVQVYPTALRGRVRGIQHHGVAVERADPGARCAVNVQGLSLADLARGRVISAPDALPLSHTLDVELAWLDVAPPVEDPAAVEFLVGTAERRARLAPIGVARIEPGARAFARVHIDGDPLAVLPGDRFVVRGFARTTMGGATLGGGRILDVAPPRRRRSDPALARGLETLRAGNDADALRVRIERAGLAGTDAEALSRETGLSPAVRDAALEALAKSGGVASTPERRWLSNAALEAVAEQLRGALAAFHAAEPLRPGMPAAALRGALPGNVPRDVASLALERLAAREAIAVQGDVVRLAAHRAVLSDAQRERAERTLAVLAETGLEAPSLRDLAARVGLDLDALRDLLAHLGREGRAVRAPGELWFDAAAVEALRERVRAHFREHDALDTPTYKALIGTTRRTAVPLMELLDAERFTVRRGEVRRPGREA